VHYIQGLDFMATTESMALFYASAAKYGFAYIENVLTQRVLADLCAESSVQFESALPAEGKGESPYRSRIAEIGDFARSFLNSSSVAWVLRSAFGPTLILSEKASCYTYYGPGDFLSRHRDRHDACAATLIVYLEARSTDPPPLDTGLVLRVFGEEVSNQTEPSLTIPTRINTLVAGRGARFWHERPSLQSKECVIALTACFRDCSSS